MDERIRDMDLLKDNLTGHLRELCLRIGSRHVGSEGERRSAAYIETVLRDYGHETVREDYPTTGWEVQGGALVDVLTGASIPMQPCFFSNAVSIEDELLWLDASALADIDPVVVRGRLCVVNFPGEVGNVQVRNRLAEQLDEAGAAAAIFPSDQVHAINTKIERSPFLRQLGVAAVSGGTLMHMHAAGRRVCRLVIQARTFAHTSANVIARVQAGPRKAVFGAHYDTAPLTQGASDNASGTAALLEAARLLKGRTGDWSVDFVAFSAEEYIPDELPPGSGDYVRRHADAPPSWFMNFDSIGFRVGATDALQVGLPERLPVLPTRLPVKAYSGAGDDLSFHSIGVPTMWYHTASPYKCIHTPADAYEGIDVSRLAAIVDDAVQVSEMLFNHE